MANKVPKIRFKGFTDDWEQRKLGDFGLATGGTSIESEFSANGKYKVISIGSYSEDSAYRDQGIRAVESEKTKTRVLNEGDLTMILNDKTSSGNIIGRALLIEKSGVYVYNQRTERIEIYSDEYDSLFIYEMLNAPQIRDKIIRQSQGNTQIYVNWTNIVGTNYLVPKIDEQRKIGMYFKRLDNLITLHQRKCDQTKELKKFMLQKMFPKKGEKNPEIRFPGFTDDWEQRKLGDVFEQTSNFVNPNEHDIELWSLTVEDGLTPKSERYNREFLVKKEDNFKEVRPGDIVYNPMNMTLGAVGYNAMGKSVAVSGYYTTMIAKENNDAYYINTWLKSPQALLLYKTYATGSLIEKQRVQFPTLSIIPASFPSFAEQQKIGKYFEELDNLITLHQRKCEQLKELKKFMLQNMFPKKG